MTMIRSGSTGGIKNPVSEDILYAADNTHNIGSISKAPKYIFIRGGISGTTASETISLRSSGAAQRILIGVGTLTNKFIIPGTTDTGYVGKATAVWKEVRATDLFGNLTGDVTGGVVAGAGKMVDVALGDFLFPAAVPGVIGAQKSYFNAATNDLYIHNGTGWVSVRLA